jgi:hypothetical protein
VGLDEICEDVSELVLLFQGTDLSFLVREQGREGVEVIVVDFRYMRVRYHDKGEVAQCLDSGGQSSGKKGEGEVG